MNIVKYTEKNTMPGINSSVTDFCNNNLDRKKEVVKINMSKHRNINLNLG